MISVCMFKKVQTKKLYYANSHFDCSKNKVRIRQQSGSSFVPRQIPHQIPHDFPHNFRDFQAKKIPTSGYKTILVFSSLFDLSYPF